MDYRFRTYQSQQSCDTFINAIICFLTIKTIEKASKRKPRYTHCSEEISGNRCKIALIVKSQDDSILAFLFVPISFTDNNHDLSIFETTVKKTCKDRLSTKSSTQQKEKSCKSFDLQDFSLVPRTGNQPGKHRKPKTK